MLGTTGLSRSLASLSGKRTRDSVLGHALRCPCSAFEQPRSIPRTVGRRPPLGVDSGRESTVHGSPGWGGTP